MSPNGPILHQTVFQEDFLAGKNLIVGKDRFSGRTHNLFRDGRGVPMGLDSHPDQDGKSYDQDDDDRISPPGRECSGRGIIV
jgi:hypothetical protein